MKKVSTSTRKNSVEKAEAQRSWVRMVIKKNGEEQLFAHTLRLRSSQGLEKNHDLLVKMRGQEGELGSL